MNWEMLSAIGQVVAAVGVIPSLIYLAVQIRQQNKERRRAGINILTTQWGELVKTGQESRDFAELFLRGIQSFQNLDAPDKLRFSAFFTRFTRNAEGMFIYYRDGALEKALSDEVEPYLLREQFMVRTPRGRVATAKAFTLLGRDMPRKSDESDQPLLF